MNFQLQIVSFGRNCGKSNLYLKMNNIKPSQYINCISKMYLDETVADVHFDMLTTNCEPKLVPAHKFLLARKSPVFRKMFEPSKDKDLDDEVFEIRDVTAEAFEEFLQMFYFEYDEVLIAENCCTVVRLCQEHCLLEFIKPIYKWFNPIVTRRNAVKYCELAIILDMEYLKQRCLRKMQEKIVLDRMLAMGQRREDDLNIASAKQQIISKLLAYRATHRKY